MAVGDSESAYSTLRALLERFPDSSQALTARLDLARIVGGVFHRPAEAMDLLRELLARDRAGALAEPATFLLCRLLAGSGDRREADSCAAGFLRDFPSSPEAPDIERLLAGPPRDVAPTDAPPEEEVLP